MSSEHAGWQWPEEMQPKEEFTQPPASSAAPHIFKTEDRDVQAEPAPEEPAPQARETNESQRQENFYPTRQCRICLEEVEPSFEPVAEGISTFLQPKPKVEYISADPQSGRLIRPCKCIGSQKYVHEGCLQEWRHADPRYGQRNFWECPTCKFKYRLERMKWSRYIQSFVAQIFLTAVIMFVIVFMLGFVADPILNLYFEPTATIASIATGGGVGGHLEFEEELEDYDGWAIHFVKGLTSIGVLGFIKVLFAMNPFTWWNLRQGGLLGGGRNRRERNESNFSFIIIIGIIAFMFALWTWVRGWCRRTLEKASERVADVQGDDDENHEHEE